MLKLKTALIVFGMCAMALAPALAAEWYVDNQAAGLNNGGAWADAWQSCPPFFIPLRPDLPMAERTASITTTSSNPGMFTPPFCSTVLPSRSIITSCRHPAQGAEGSAYHGYFPFVMT